MGMTLLMVGAIAALLTIARLISSQQLVNHTHEVQLAISQVNTIATRAGRTRTEYIDSGDPEKLREHQQMVSQIPEFQAALQRLTRDNARQQNKLITIAGLSDQRIHLLQESIAQKQSGISTLESQAAITRKLVAISNQTDSVLQAMQDDEQRLLTERLDRGERVARLVAFLLGSTFLIACLFLILHYRLLTRELLGRQRAETSLRSLSARILQIQDEERRKFSRDLHDSLGQYLVGTKMNIDILAAEIPDNPVLVDSSELLERALAETRTISHLLHPPMLDETGFATAARWYVDGFSKRSGIKTSIDIPENFDRLAPALEIALFRVLQESLTNVHRHSRCSEAEVTVALDQQNVVLQIRDNGAGMPPDFLERFRSNAINTGVGLAGMRERIREIGGHLDVHSDAGGTLIAAALPRRHANDERRFVI
jgi:signal transduction histidine kinase